MKKSFSIILFLFVVGLVSSFGQGQKKLIQVSGLVVTADSNAYGLVGAYVYVKESGRGSITNHYGYFSFACLVGQEITIRHLGYKTQYFQLPNDTNDQVSLLVELTRDTTILPVVEITYFPTEEAFKKAVLTAKLPNEYSFVDKNLNDQILERMFANSDMSASVNHSYYMNQQILANQRKYLAPHNPLLDPFAWGRFISDITKRKKKKKKRR